MAHLPFIFFTLTLTWLGLPGVSSTVYTMRQGQRLAESPLRSVTFSEGQGSLTRCVMACKSSEGCFSVNVHTDGLTSTITCELLDVYLHEAINGLTSVTDWTFIQEGWYVLLQGGSVSGDSSFPHSLLTSFTHYDGLKYFIS